MASSTGFDQIWGELLFPPLSPDDLDVLPGSQLSQLSLHPG